MPGILKCGMTSRTPPERLHEANSSDTWRPPTPFVIEFAKRVSDPMAKESHLHQILKDCRIHTRREYFRVSKERVLALFNDVKGEDWVAPIIDKPDDYDFRKTRLTRVPKHIPLFTDAVGEKVEIETATKQDIYICERCGFTFSHAEFKQHLSNETDECVAVLSDVTKNTLLNKYFEQPLQQEFDFFRFDGN